LRGSPAQREPVPEKSGQTPFFVMHLDDLALPFRAKKGCLSHFQQTPGHAPFDFATGFS
jgi:hypothetical protein